MGGAADITALQEYVVICVIETSVSSANLYGQFLSQIGLDQSG